MQHSPDTIKRNYMHASLSKLKYMLCYHKYASRSTAAPPFNNFIFHTLPTTNQTNEKTEVENHKYHQDMHLGQNIAGATQ